MSEVEVEVESADDLISLPPCFGAAAAEVEEEEQQRMKVTGRYDSEVGGGEEEAKPKQCLRGRDDQTFKASIVIRAANLLASSSRGFEDRRTHL
ncbi:hypothetical protein Lser_V15G28640 [Lactuca serriola]